MIASYVDVDSVLWDFYGEFIRRLSKHTDKHIPTDIYNLQKHLGIPDNIYWAIVNNIHKTQKSFEMFPWSIDFLKGLHDIGHNVIIISGRGQQHMNELSGWLTKHKADKYVDKIICSGRNKKSSYFEHKYCFVFDDSPYVLTEKCPQDSKCITVAISYGYNKDVRTNYRFDRTIDSIPVISKITDRIRETL